MLEEACLALAIYWEARNQPIEGQTAVAEVVINRVASPRFPNNICAVVKQRNGRRCDFSWYCDGKSDVPKNQLAWKKASWVARVVIIMHSVSRVLPVNTYYFHSTSVDPPYFKKKQFVTQIGDHMFYKESRN